MRRALAILAVTFVTGCTIWPVGEDPYGMELRRQANATILALQAYHRDTGSFPASLSALSPRYLPAPIDIPRSEYHAEDGSLSYKYTPSWPQLRPVWCSSVGNATDWKCDEHLL
jgi:hypothetical protein